LVVWGRAYQNGMVSACQVVRSPFGFPKISWASSTSWYEAVPMRAAPTRSEPGWKQSLASTSAARSIDRSSRDIEVTRRHPPRIRQHSRRCERQSKTNRGNRATARGGLVGRDAGSWAQAVSSGDPERRHTGTPLRARGSDHTHGQGHPQRAQARTRRRHACGMCGQLRQPTGGAEVASRQPTVRSRATTRSRGVQSPSRRSRLLEKPGLSGTQPS
jgi:hypothetical protein